MLQHIWRMNLKPTVTTEITKKIIFRWLDQITADLPDSYWNKQGGSAAYFRLLFTSCSHFIGRQGGIKCAN